MDAQTKASIKHDFQRHEGDTGSVEVQVALITARIKALSDHLQNFKKDHSSRRGLIMLVNKRRSLLEYAKRKSKERYHDLVKRLGLRH